MISYLISSLLYGKWQTDMSKSKKTLFFWCEMSPKLGYQKKEILVGPNKKNHPRDQK